MATQSLKYQITTGFKEVYGKLQELAANADVAQSIREIDSGYLLFDEYFILRTTNVWCVSHKQKIFTQEFNSISNAVFYTMAMFGNNKKLARDIARLDLQYNQKQFDIQNKIHILKEHPELDAEKRDVILIKLDEDLKHSRQLKHEIKKCANQAKYMQNKGSYYEFTRTGTNR